MEKTQATVEIVRRPAAAGRFYPDDPAELAAMIDRQLDAVDQSSEHGKPAPKAIIAPHAGYIYSGPIAASAYARLRRSRGRVTNVVLIGPAHRVAFRGLAAPNAAAFATPLGAIPVDRDSLASLTDLPRFVWRDDAHLGEHSLEVHLPFLQRVLGDFALVPLVAGDATDSEVAAVLERLWGGAETLIVVSSDLSHYEDYATARRHDTATADAITALMPEAIGWEQACGRIPIGGLLLAARRRGLRARLIDLRNSGDTAGDRRQVVGYGSFLFN